MQAIRPHLWFDGQAIAAANFYAGTFPNSAVHYTSAIPMDSGDCAIVEFSIDGHTFLGIDGGPGQKPNPSISFMVHFDADEADLQSDIWARLAEGGTVMMALDKYPFSEKYGWVADRFGVSWQLMQRQADGPARPRVMPALLFTPPAAGKAEEAINLYTSIFTDGKLGNLAPRPEDMGPDKKGTLMYADFFIDNTWLVAMDSAHAHGFVFNDAISLLIPCDTQAEIDACWAALTAGGKPGQCGWLKDKFGVSWQVASTTMFEVLKSGDRERIGHVMDAFMQMQKVNAADLKKAFEG